MGLVVVLCWAVGGHGGFGSIYFGVYGGVDGEGTVGHAFHAVG